MAIHVDRPYRDHVDYFRVRLGLSAVNREQKCPHMSCAAHGRRFTLPAAHSQIRLAVAGHVPQVKFRLDGKEALSDLVFTKEFGLLRF